jgi:hypothetical protein
MCDDATNKNFPYAIRTFEENDPLFAVVISSDVEPGHAAVVAGHVVVVEELSVQPVGRFVSPLVEGLGELSERVRREALGGCGRGGGGCSGGRGGGSSTRRRRCRRWLRPDKDGAECAEEAEGD